MPSCGAASSTTSAFPMPRRWRDRAGPFSGDQRAAAGHGAGRVLRNPRDAGPEKKPSTSEVLDWLKLILAEDLAPEDLKRDPKALLPRCTGRF